jgi:hypothetical protein
MKLTIEINDYTEIVQLMTLFNTMHLEHIQVVVDKGALTTVENSQDLLASLQGPISEKLDLEALKQAKKYKGVNRKRFDNLIKEINIIEPINILLGCN